MTRHPIQPIEKAKDGVLRFKRNAIVEMLLDAGPHDMNTIACLPFSREDREQFAQLIGYSVAGANSLHYVSRETIDAAKAMAATGESQDAALARIATEKLNALRVALREPMADLFDVHPDDLGCAADADDEDDGCPVGDPGCLSRSDECHTACEAPKGPACGHSACSQNFIDTGSAECVEVDDGN